VPCGLSRLRLGLIFKSFGPYHWARARALSEISDARVAELVLYDPEYEWNALASDRSDLRICAFAEKEPACRRERMLAADRLQSWLSETRPDAVAIPGWSEPLALLALANCRRLGIPTVVMSDSRADDAPRNAVQEAVKSKIVREFDAALVAGEQHARYVMSLGLPDDRIFSGLDVVDNDHFGAGADRARAGLNSLIGRRLPPRYVLACSRLVAKKDVDTIIKAFALFSQSAEAQDWRLVIAGDGPLRTGLEQLAARLIVGKTLFLGRVQYDDLPTLYGCASAFVLASRSDQWGLVVNEAMASGTPVVVSRGAGAAEALICDGQNGFTFRPGDVEGLAAVLGRLTDEDLRVRMGAAGRRTIEQWRPQRFAEGLLAAAQAAITHSSKRDRGPPIATRLLLTALTAR